MALEIDPEHLASARSLFDGFDELLNELANSHVHLPRERPAPPQVPGVYVLSQGGAVVHVGRTRNLQARRRDHTMPGGDRNVSTFAFRLARGRASDHDPPLPQLREELALDPAFKSYFSEAKAAVRKMEFRCVRIDDPPRQAMFEIFASVALNSPHNDWSTH